MAKLTPEERRARIRASQRKYRETHRTEILARRREQARQNGIHAKTQRYKRVRQEREAGYQKPKHCEICGDDTARLVFDHCHQRGVFRGWICMHCNVILGHARDDANHLRKLIAYLERTKDLVPPQLTLPL